MMATALIIVLFLFLLLMTIWGPYILSGVATEQRKWKWELMRRRAAEQSRIDDWEGRFRERQHQEMVRQEEWEQELMQRRLAEQLRIKEWEQRFETRRRQEKIRQDEWEREEEKRQKLGLYWDTPVADSHCTAYNSREYWARLLNTVPFDYNWLKPCQDIPLVIHGRSLKTTRCYINEYVSSLNQFSGHQ
jgi:hypothetical protein